jgi:hypothetical protein
VIVANESIFPNNVVELTAMAMQRIDTDLTVVRRPLRSSDPQQSVGVHAQLWTPDEESYEMIGALSREPTMQQYLIAVQAFVKHGDEEVGLATHSALSNYVRSVLYRDADLRVALQGLSVKYLNGTLETLKRWGIRTQRYFSNEIDAQWLYLSTLEFWIETEIE